MDGIDNAVQKPRGLQLSAHMDAANVISRDLISQKGGASPGVEKFLQKRFDSAALSQEVMDEVKGMNPKKGDVKNIIKNIADTKLQSAIDGAQKLNKKTRKRPEIEVQWTPKISENQDVKKGQPWGSFQIIKKAKDGAGAGVGGSSSPKGDNVIFNTPTGEKAKPGQNKKKPKIKVNSGAAKGGKKGKGGGSMSWQADESGKVFIVDSASGRRIQVPENGDVTAEKDMKIKSVGGGGKLKGGETLFTYTMPKGKHNIEDEAKKKMGVKTRGINPEKSGTGNRPSAPGSAPGGAPAGK